MLFLGRHRTSRDGIAFAIGEMNNDAKQISTRIRLAENIIRGIFAIRLGTQHQGPTEADLLDLLRRDIVEAT